MHSYFSPISYLFFPYASPVHIQKCLQDVSMLLLYKQGKVRMSKSELMMPFRTRFPISMTPLLMNSIVAPIIIKTLLPLTHFQHITQSSILYTSSPKHLISVSSSTYSLPSYLRIHSRLLSNFPVSVGLAYIHKYCQDKI